MKKVCVIFSFLLMSSASLYSQDYNTGIGIKFGGLDGISFKQFVGSQSAFEIVAGARWNGVQVLALYEIYAPAFDAPGLYWYYGAGGHLGFWEGYRRGPFDRDYNSFVGVGIDGVLGLEYKIEDIPVAISFDIVPAFNIVEHPHFWFDGGLGIRYVF